MKAILNALYKPTAGILVLRIAVAGLMLLHGIAKLQGGVNGIVGKVEQMGLPGFVGYGVLLGEVVAPLMVLSGLFVGPAALVMAFNMVVAVAMAHTGDLFHMGKMGGYALELQALYLLGSVAIALTASPKQR